MVATSGFLGLGSNEATFEGSPKEQLELALARLEAPGVEVLERSSFYLSEPVGGPAQPWFVNAAARVRFDGKPLELLRICQSIETAQGRRRIVRNGPRTLDIDILLFGNLVLETRDLALPHPRLAERRFALVPLVEIAADVRHPVLGSTMRELLSRCPDRSAVTPLLTTKRSVSP